MSNERGASGKRAAEVASANPASDVEAPLGSRTVGEISHDLNNVLTSVLGYAEMIAEDAQASRVDARDAQHLLAATREAVALVKALRSTATDGGERSAG